jgi:maleate isomerase
MTPTDPEASAIPGRIRLGMLTPSSNSVLEPVSARMLADVPDVTIHASRFRVTQIGLSQQAVDQFATDGMVAAAELLADAKVGSIMWNGTSAAWLGFASDERLADAITARTGVPASSSVLAFRDAFRMTGAVRVGLVTPYTTDVQARIRENWGAAGFTCPAERHAGLSENFAFARLGEAEIADMARAVAAEGVDVVAIVCTNMAGAEIAPALEEELGIPVIDSVAVTLWKALTLAGCGTQALARFGSIFRT